MVTEENDLKFPLNCFGFQLIELGLTVASDELILANYEVYQHT